MRAIVVKIALFTKLNEMENMIHIAQTIEELELMGRYLSDQPLIAFDTETTSLSIKDMELDGLGIGTGEKQYYIPVNRYTDLGPILRVLNALFDRDDLTFIFHNAKFDLQVMKKFGMHWPKKIHDTLMISFLIDENIPHDLKSLTVSFLKREVTKYKELNRNVDLFRKEEDVINDMATYCCADVKNTFDLFERLYPELEPQKLLADYLNIELPFIYVLASMEYTGVMIDKAWLEQKRDEVAALLKDLEEQIKEICGTGVNIQSPTQLEKYLFDVLKYDVIKATTAGKRSTDNEVLEEIVKKYDLKETDFVPLLLKFRDFDKLYRTYFIGLLEQGGKDSIIHTSFMQHGTRTGRLSSKDPNLQNIPARHDEWEIRQAFVARPGHSFVICDYSQIELRVLAHFTQDPNMLSVFQNDGDIHAKTMELTHTERRVAKTINFGLIYGMGSHSLAKKLDLKIEEAEEYMNRFFAGYPTVKQWMAKIQAQTLYNGYVVMLTGRRRRFYEIKDKQWYGMVKRQSVNTKVQGSAADIIKIAMIKLHSALKPINGKILMQIHDELIVEVPDENLEDCKTLVVDTMDKAVELRVPLKVSMESSKHWVKG